VARGHLRDDGDRRDPARRRSGLDAALRIPLVVLYVLAIGLATFLEPRWRE
jgi:hypothetical protein